MRPGIQSGPRSPPRRLRVGAGAESGRVGCSARATPLSQRRPWGDPLWEARSVPRPPSPTVTPLRERGPSAAGAPTRVHTSLGPATTRPEPGLGPPRAPSPPCAPKATVPRTLTCEQQLVPTSGGVPQPQLGPREAQRSNPCVTRARGPTEVCTPWSPPAPQRSHTEHPLRVQTVASPNLILAGGRGT